MIAGKCAKNAINLSEHFRRLMRNHMYSSLSEAPSRSCCLIFKQGCSMASCSSVSKSYVSLCSPVCGFQVQRIRLGSLPKKKGKHITVETTGSCLDLSFKYQSTTLRLLAPKGKVLPSIECNVKRGSGSEGRFSAGLLLGSLVCCSTSDPVHAEAPQEKEEKEEQYDSSSTRLSHGKRVHKDYSIIGIPGDGRCLFRSVAHGACLRSGVPAPNESAQRQLADELRAKVADEFIRRREETEWFIEGDFDSYVSQIRKPHVWGGEPELLMLSHVLKMPITVYMRDEDSGGLISIAEYGQEYGKKNPIQVLYHGFGHYDALLIPGKKDTRPRL